MDWSRRHALSVIATGFTTAVAGCQTGDEAADPPEEPKPEHVEPAEVSQVRSDETTVLFTESDSDTNPDEAPDSHHRESAHIASRGELESYSWGETDEAQQLCAFVHATDFETQSVYLFATTVNACREIRLESMTRDPDGGPDGDFCTTTRPADVACDTDDIDTVGFAIRLPYTVSRASGLGTGMSSDCHGPDRPRPFEATVVPWNGSEES